MSLKKYQVLTDESILNLQFTIELLEILKKYDSSDVVKLAIDNRIGNLQAIIEDCKL